MKTKHISKQTFEQVISNTNSMASAAAELGLHFSTFKRHALKFGVYVPNQGLRGGNKPSNAKIPLDEILDGKHPQYQSYKLKRRLVDEEIIKYECSECGITEWQGKPISLELDHKDGDSTNHDIDNLRLLCPNCHSQTETFRFKRGKQVRIVQ